MRQNNSAVLRKGRGTNHSSFYQNLYCYVQNHTINWLDSYINNLKFEVCYKPYFLKIPRCLSD